MSSFPQGLIRLIVGHVCIHACMAGIRMAGPLWLLSQGAGKWQVGMMISLFAFAQALLSIAAGRYVDRHGLKRPLRIAIVVALVGAVLPAALTHGATLALAAFATGGATGLSLITLQTYVGRVSSDSTQRTAAFSWMATGPALANFIGPMLAGLLIDHAGYQWAFAGLFALVLVAALILLRVKPAPMPPHPTAAQTQPRQRTWQMLKTPALRRLLLINWASSVSWDVHSFVIPIIGHERGFSASSIGAILGTFALAAVCVRLLIPLLAKHLPPSKTIAVAIGIAGLCLLAFPWLPSALAMGVCAAILGFTLGTMQPMVMTLLHHIAPPHQQGQAVGLRMLVLNVSSLLMPLLFGAAGGVVGVGAIFVVAALGDMLAARTAWRLQNSQPQPST